VSRAIGLAQAQVLHVGDGLLEQLGDVVVVEVVDDLTTVAPPDDEAQVTQDAQLVGDRRALHADVSSQLVDPAGAGGQSPENP